MNDVFGKEVEIRGRSLIFGYYPSICVKGVRKTTKTLSQGSLTPSRHLNPGPFDSEARGLTALNGVRSHTVAIFFLFMNKYC
jgi:hypothetical protein